MIWLILVISLILRFILINQSLWLDEGINVNSATQLSFKDLFLHYSLGDFHPPLYHLVLKAWIQIVGNSELAVRIPSVLFGVITTGVTYLIGKKLFDKKTALIAATLIATSPLHIYYSQEARMYMLAAFLASASVYFFLEVIQKETLLKWTGFIVATALLLYTDYLPYFLIPVYIAYVLINRKKIPKATLKSFIPAIIIIAIAISPWLYILPKQLQVGLSVSSASPAWAQVVGSPSPQQLGVTFVKFIIGRISHDNNVTYALLLAPIGLFVAFLLSLSIFRLSPVRSFLWYWFLIPVVAAYVVSYFIPVFAYFRFIFILPALYLILASAIKTINWPPLIRVLLAGMVGINIICTTIYFVNPKFHREDWKNAVNFVHQNASENSLVLFESDYTVGPFDYYNSRLSENYKLSYNKDKVKGEGALDNFSPNKEKVDQLVEQKTKDKNKIFLFQYLGGITDPQGFVFERLTSLGFKNTNTKDFPGVGFIYTLER